MLKRAELRKLIQRKLMNKTGAQERVYSALPFTTAAEDMPCILVYCTQENSATAAKHSAMYETTTSINIEVRVSEDYLTAEDTLDEICEQVETLLLQDYELQTAVEAISAWNTQKGWEDGGDYSFCIAIITMQVEYKREIAPAVDGYYLQAKVDVDAINPHDPNLAATGPDGRIEASLDLTVPQ